VRYHPGRLFTGERHACYRSSVFIRGFSGRQLLGPWLFVNRADLSCCDHHPVGYRVVGELHRADGPLRLNWFLELEFALGRDRRRGGKVGEHFAQPTCKEKHLVLLELQGHNLVVLAGLEVEDTLARRPYRSNGHSRGARQVE